MIRSAFVGAAIGLLAPCCAMGQAGDPCPAPGDAAKIVVFNHRQGSILSPSPTVLELRDGEVFAIEFCYTLPSRFEYEITPIEPAKERTTDFTRRDESAIVDPNDLTSTMLSWKHQEEFSLYQVSVSVRQGEENPEIATAGGMPALENVIRGMSSKNRARVFQELGVEPAQESEEVEEIPSEEAIAAIREMSTEEVREALRAGGVPVPEELKPVYLYSYSFPVWVRTIDWSMSFTSGVAFSDLVDDKFFIETDTKGTTDAADDVKLVRRNRSDLGDSRPDLVAFVNLLSPDAGPWGKTKLGGHLGAAFGLGLNGEGEPRYYFGPSWTIGRKRYFVVTAGWSGGPVDRLPPGQGVDKAPLNDNVLSKLDSSFEHGFFAGLTFSFNRRDEKDFTSALTGKAGRTDTNSETQPDS